LKSKFLQSYHDKNYANLLNTMYVVAVTFLAVGYGDMVPHTYCGRIVCVCSGLLGVSCAAIVAVLSTKLQLSIEEKYAHDFMIGNELSKKLKHKAADVIKYFWLAYKFKKYEPNKNDKIIEYLRKLHIAINNIKRTKKQHVKVLDNVDTTNKDVHNLFQVCF
jgi:potassium intermediate/small conductance calcium-activated channel subfamily N member 3